MQPFVIYGPIDKTNLFTSTPGPHLSKGYEIMNPLNPVQEKIP